MFKSSVIVLAHPDDEVLWFSSILDKAGSMVFCFLGCDSKPHWSAARRNVLSEHPVRNISSLDLDESGAFNAADWLNPVVTKYGLALSNNAISEKYEGNYQKIKQGLKEKLIGCSNVFTHNPWGEYGNEEHVQVYRAVKELQEEIKFSVWFPNYCSNHSVNLMLPYIAGYDCDYVTLQTNSSLKDRIRNLYITNNCWTWYNDWKWFREESFMKDRYDISDLSSETSHKKRALRHKDDMAYGHLFPLNFMRVDICSRSTAKSRLSNVRKAMTYIRRRLG